MRGIGIVVRRRPAHVTQIMKFFRVLSVSSGIFLIFGHANLVPAEIDHSLSVPPLPGKPWEPAWGFWQKAPPDSWQQTHWGFVQKARKGGIDVLFLGDSLTKGWSESGKEVWRKSYAPLKALNIGIGGDTTRQVLWRLEHGAMEGIQPRVVVLMIGVNNIFTQTGTDDEIAEGIGAVVQKVRSLNPSSKILLLGLLPLGNEAQNGRLKAINAKIATLAAPDVRFLDMSSDFQDENGRAKLALYLADQVHLAGSGYEVWNAAMTPVLQEMLQ